MTTSQAGGDWALQQRIWYETMEKQLSDKALDLIRANAKLSDKLLIAGTTKLCPHCHQFIGGRTAHTRRKSLFGVPYCEVVHEVYRQRQGAPHKDRSPHSQRRNEVIAQEKVCIANFYIAFCERQEPLGTEFEAAIFDDLDSLYES